MQTTEATVVKATAGLDDDLKPEEVTQENTVGEKDGKKPEAPEKGDDPVKEKDPKDDTKAKGSAGNDDDAGYTADEVDEIEEDAPTTSVETAQLDTSKLDDEAKYIVEKLPLMVARIKEGDKVKEVQVKSWTQLPEDVEFASKRDELAFMNALTAQENRALKLQQEFQQTKQTEQNKDFEKRENDAIRQDIAELQKAGDLPKFKARPEDAEFAKDPASQEVQKVLDFMTERNEQYLKEYNQGRPYRHIGFREAYLLYQRANPKASDDQKREDTERKDIAKKTTNNRGLSSRELKKPTVRSGTRVSDILERYEREL